MSTDAVFLQDGLIDPDDDVLDTDYDPTQGEWKGVSLTYREKLAVHLRSSEAALKAWDTRGRGQKKDTPGGTRTKAPSGPVTMRKATAADADRIKELKLPPAWTDVHLNDDPNGRLVAYGYDKKGRKQPRYSTAHDVTRDAEKFARVKEFSKALPDLRKTISEDIKRGADPEDREAASVLYLIDKTAFRPGSDRETLGDVKAFGASTLESQHVKVDGNKVSFDFVGKKGVAVSKTVEDETLARMVASRAKSGGRLFDTTDSRVRSYTKRKLGDFKPKDFRTYSATAMALRTMRGMPKPKDAKEYKKAQRAVAKAVASHLGNTPAVSLKSYIDPATWSKWQI